MTLISGVRFFGTYNPSRVRLPKQYHLLNCLSEAHHRDPSENLHTPPMHTRAFIFDAIILNCVRRFSGTESRAISTESSRRPRPRERYYLARGKYSRRSCVAPDSYKLYCITCSYTGLLLVRSFVSSMSFVFIRDPLYVQGPNKT